MVSNQKQNNLSHTLGGTSNEFEQNFPPAIILCLVHIQSNFGNRNPSNDLYYTPPTPLENNVPVENSRCSQSQRQHCFN
jgi:hypothetical protein